MTVIGVPRTAVQCRHFAPVEFVRYAANVLSDVVASVNSPSYRLDCPIALSLKAAKHARRHRGSDR
jgi:hypothetical protein